MARRSLEPPKGNSIQDVCKRFGLHVRTARRRMGYTQEDLAERLDLTTNFIAHLERGSRRPSLDTIVAVSQLFELPLENFFKVNAAPATSSKDSPLVRRAYRLIKEASKQRLDLVVRLLEQMAPPVQMGRPSRGRRR